jgi:ABC-type phosphate transport system substrate-binding protein
VVLLAFYWYQDGGGAAHAPRPDAVTRVTDGFVSIAIQNDQTLDFVAPSRESITSSARSGAAGAIVAATSLYPPALVRQFHWNIPKNNSPQEVVAKIGPVLNTGFSIDGDQALRNYDFLPLSVLEKSIMSARLIVGSGLRSSTNRSVGCGDSELAGGRLVVAGATVVHSLAELWAGVFETLCAPDAIRVNVTETVVKDGSTGSNNDTSSSESARLVCGQNEEASAIDIGTMDRDWLFPVEAAASNQNGQFECADSGKQVLQVHVATQALSVVASLQGSAFACLEHLGGLTMDELRWIFSNLSEQELMNDGVVGVPSNSDGNAETHLWSELDVGNENGTSLCPDEEILLAGPEEMSLEYNFMSRLLFNQGIGETIDRSRETSDYSYFSSSVPQYIIDYLAENGNAIAFLPYGIATANKNMLATAHLSDNANPPQVMPDPASLDAGHYPLVQALYMNLNMNAANLAYSLPYMEFGLSPYGQRLAEMAGHVPLSNETLREMKNRLAFLKNLSIDDSTSNSTTAAPIPATEPPTVSLGTPDTPQPTMSSTAQPSLSPETEDTSQPMVSPAPTTQPVPATLPPTTNQSNDVEANQTTSDKVDSSTRDIGSSSSGRSLKNSHLGLGSTLTIAVLLLS